MYDISKKYRLDRNIGSAMTFEEANNHHDYWKHQSLKERLDAAFYLIHRTYGVQNTTPLDRTVFPQRRHDS